MEQHLQTIKNAKFGIETRIPVHFALQQTHNDTAYANSRRIQLNTTFINTVRTSTTNSEVVTARSTYQMLGDRIDHIETLIKQLEDLVGVDGDVPTNQTSNVTYIITE